MSLTKATYSMIDGAPVNVLDFGAVGDGVTDDTAAIQAALNASQNKVLFVPAGTYKISATIYTGKRGSILGEGPRATKFLLTHAGVGFYTRDLAPQVDYTRNQTYSNFGIVCNTATTEALWVIKTLYCTFNNIEITVPQAAGATFTGWRVAGSLYFTNFINCVCDTIEENSAVKQGGKAWWIGNGENAEGSIFAATNANLWVGCRGVRADVCFDIDNANGCTIIGGGAEHSVTAGYHVRGDYVTITDSWVEDADIVFDQYIPQDGSGGFLPARSPAYATVSLSRPVSDITVNYATNATISNSRVSNLTINTNATGTNVNDLVIFGTLTDNGADSNLEYVLGADRYQVVKNGSSVVYSAKYANGDTQIDLNGSQYIRSQRFGPLSFSSDANFKFTGTSPIFEIGKATAPGSSPANTAYLFVRDNGSGKMQLAARFPSGVIQVITTEP
jgi:hypothetical protein